VYNNFDFDFVTQINTKNDKQGNNLAEKTDPSLKKGVLLQKNSYPV